MAYDHRSVIEAQYVQLNADRAAAVAAYEAGRVAEDQYETMSAADRVLEADQKLMALNRIADTFVASQQQQANRFGLNRDELEVAKVSGISDEQYARNKQRMQRMKAEGYWDQGRVFK